MWINVERHVWSEYRLSSPSLTDCNGSPLCFSAEVDGEMWCYRKPGFEALLLAELQRQQQRSQFCDTLLQTEGRTALEESSEITQTLRL